MSFRFQGYQLTPGMIEPIETSEVQITWERFDQLAYVAGIVDKDTVDTGNTGQTSQLRAGLAMGKITSTGQYTHWDPYAVDGSQYLVGFLWDTIDLSYIGGTTKERMNAIIIGGKIKADAVVIPGVTARGLSGTTYEFLLREQAKHRFLFDDDLGAYQTIKEYTVTADLTVTAAMNNTLFVYPTGAAADLTLTLPAPRPGLQYHILNANTTAANELILDGPATGEFWVGGAAADTLSPDGDTSIVQTIRAVKVTVAGPVYCYAQTAVS